MIPGYDSLTTAAIKIRIKNNADSSPSVFSETSQILQGDFSNVTIVSNDTFYYSGTSTAFLFQNCSPPAIDSLKLRGLNTNTFGLNYFSTQGKCRISNSHVDSFRIQLYLRFGDLDLQKTWLVNGRGSNATNIWLENISAYTFELHCGYDTPGVNAGCFRAIGSNRIWLRRVYASNDPSMGANNMIFRGLNGNIYIDLNGGIDSLTSENVSGYNAYTIDVSSTPPNPINFIPVNTVTDQGVYAVPGTPYSFQESTTASEPSAAEIRYYYNTDEEELKISDGVSWYGLAKTLTATASLDFSSTSAQNSADLTITVTGAADGDAVSLGVPNAAVNANTSFSAWVSAANTVTVRFNNYSSGAVDPASGTFRVAVLKY